MRIFGEETSRSACGTTSEPVSAIFLRLPGLAPDRRGSKEGDHPTIYIYIYIYIASDRCEIRRLTVGLAGARPKLIFTAKLSGSVYFSPAAFHVCRTKSDRVGSEVQATWFGELRKSPFFKTSD